MYVSLFASVLSILSVVRSIDACTLTLYTKLIMTLTDLFFLVIFLTFCPNTGVAVLVIFYGSMALEKGGNEGH